MTVNRMTRVKRPMLMTVKNSLLGLNSPSRYGNTEIVSLIYSIADLYLYNLTAY